MALVVKDRVRETTTTTGTGTITLAGAVLGFQSFVVIGNANTTYYAIVDPVAGSWEVGIGTYTSAGTLLSRDTVLESSAGGAKVSFVSGTKDVFVTYPAERSVSQADVGTDPNEIPLNQYLGSMAYQDRLAVNIGGGVATLGTATVTTIQNDTAISNVEPSLMLNFAAVEALDPRITYTRASTATYYNGVTTAVAEQNLLTYSQELNNAAWTTSSTTITANAAAAPDGTTTAELMYPTTTGTIRIVGRLSFPATASAVYTLSVYAKASGINFVYFLTLAGGNTGPECPFFDLQNGTVAQLGTFWTSATITDVGNGWYRCTATGTAPSASIFPNFGVADANNNGTATKNGTDGILLWGAQLEQRSSVTAYTVTTTQPITNYIPVLLTAASGVPRFEHNPISGDSLGFLVEQQSTNLVTYSSGFDNAAWTKTNVTLVANQIIAPDGTLTGDKLIPSVVNTQHIISPADIAAGTYTWSAYFKSAEYTNAAISCFDGISYKVATLYNLSNGTIVQSVAGTVSTITPVGNGWFRCTVTGTLAAGSSFGGANFRPNINGVQAVESAAGDGYSGIYIWGAQLEAGAFATSYIATVASQVTRAADAASMTGTNFSSWFNNAEGTVYCEATPAKLDANTSPLWTMGTTNTNFINCYASTARALYISVNNVNVVDLSPGTSINVFRAGVKSKVASAYKTNDCAAVVTGSSVVTDTSNTLPIVTRLGIGQTPTADNFYCGTITKLAYYPRRLTNEELQEMTS